LPWRARLLLEHRERVDRDHRPLPVGQVPPHHVQREHVRSRALDAPLLEAWFDAGVLAGAVPIAAVEDLALVEDDRLQEPVLADVVDEFPELGPPPA
jgi:hypothetical protein